MTKLSCTYRLPYNVDCLEFSSSHPELLACGMYQLIDDKSQLKKGAVGFLKLDNSTNEFCFFNFENFCENLETQGGVFQIKWFNDFSNLSCVTTDGYMQIFDVDYERRCAKLLRNIKISDDALLNLDFANNLSDFNYVVSTDKGRLHVGNMENISGDTTWDAHVSQNGVASEIWCCLYNPFNNKILYSGGDDCAFKCWDLRDLRNPIFVDKKCHKAGVTCVSCFPKNENFLFTGSYDDNLRSWDIRNIRQPVETINLAGGVWNIKLNPENPDLILCSCMYNGWAIVDYELCKFRMINSETFEGRLLYGVDWYPANAKSFACCTFYDNTVMFYV